ncbi:MAG: DoxX family membrane protein [Candidatus Poribacteria bacterium]|nr:DoxX family membrane protein [Candidatus Poribacteria bacterium]
MIILLLVTVLRIILGTILFFAGIAKLADFSTFVTAVVSYQMLPTALVKPISYLLVSAEITLGIALSIGYFSRGAGILASLLFLIFAAALTNVLLQKLSVMDCGCANFLFSLLENLGLTVSTPNWILVFSNVVFAVVSFGMARSPQRGYGLESLIHQMQRSEN